MHCPVALNIQGLVEAFRESRSHESVEVTVTTAERTFSKATTLHEGISSLLGLIMATSGCPIMERLKPMARFHLPFASLEETTYRMLSMYLVAQLFVKRSGGTPDWDLEELGQFLSEKQGHHARWPVAVLGDDHLGDIGMFCFRRIVFVTIYKNNDICVLFDGS